MPEYDLKIRTKKFAVQIIHLYGKLPKGTAAKTIGNQFIRSGTSVGANYREADCARSRAEFLAKLGDCLKESSETEYWLELLIETDLMNKDSVKSLLNENQQITKTTYLDKPIYLNVFFVSFSGINNCM